jgi:hypothetical protein
MFRSQMFWSGNFGIGVGGSEVASALKRSALGKFSQLARRVSYPVLRASRRKIDCCESAASFAQFRLFVASLPRTVIRFFLFGPAPSMT